MCDEMRNVAEEMNGGVERGGKFYGRILRSVSGLGRRSRLAI